MSNIFEKQIERLKKAYDVKNINQLATALGLKANSNIYSWKKSGRVPEKILLQAEIEKGVSKKWLETGEGEMFATGSVSQQANGRGHVQISGSNNQVSSTKSTSMSGLRIAAQGLLDEMNDDELIEATAALSQILKRRNER